VTALEHDLDPFTNADLDSEVDDLERREAWFVANDGDASWALRKVWKFQREVKRINDQYDETFRILSERKAEALAGPMRDLGFFEARLADYHQRLIDEGAADKTYRLPAGELVARKSPDTVAVVDEDALFDFAEGADRLDLIRIKREADKKALLAAVKAGESVPGVELKSGTVNFSARPFEIGLVSE